MKRILSLVFIYSSMCIVGSAYGLEFQREAIRPLPVEQTAKDPSPIAELGRSLFTYKGLSKHNVVSCQSCHRPSKAYSQTFSGFIQTPSLLNQGLMNRYFWNGRAKTLKEAIRITLYDAGMMGNDETTFIQSLSEDKTLVDQFKKVFPDGLTEANLVHALEHYILTLKSPDSRFDRFLRGEMQALSKDERKGYDLFQNYGCINCHQGIAVGGNLMQKFGIYREAIKNPSEYDLGYYQITQDEADMYVFRVPSLRNIQKTRPYFHNGSAKTLKEAIQIMGEVQLNQKIPSRDVKLIEQFLYSLTGEWESD